MIPKISYSITPFEQPSTKKKLNFRPFLVKEERILLLAKAADNFIETLKAIKQIVQNCCLEPEFDVEKLAIFDLEMLYINLHSVSVSDVQRFTSVDHEDGQKYEHLINFNDVKVTFPVEAPSNKVKVNSDLTVVMKYPTVDLISDKDLSENLAEKGIETLIVNCIDKVFERDRLVKMTPQEKYEFIDNLSLKTFEAMKDFILNVPKIDYKIHWTNSLGHQKYWHFSSIKDFFLFV